MGATTTPALVGTPADIDAAYLTTVLRHAGFSDVAVGTFSASNIGTGQVGQNIRFALDYEAGAGPHVPAHRHRWPVILPHPNLTLPSRPQHR